MKNTIIISEVSHIGEIHFQVNSCFIEMITKSNPSSKVMFVAEKKHVSAVRFNLELSNIQNLEYLPFEGFYNEEKFKWRSRIIGECKQILKIFKLAALHKNELFIWTCLFPTGHLFLNILLLFKKNTKHIIILHGELELLKGKRKSEIFLGIILKLAFFLSSKKNKYIVLGDNIKKSLKGLLSNSTLDKTYSILHPYNFCVNKENLINKEDYNGLNIGAIGTQMLSKNSNCIYDLGEYFKSEVINNKINLLTIGKVLPELKKYQNGFVRNLYSDSFVSQQKFELEISKLDFVIFFYDNNSYKLCASGAIFEAIRLEVPIISIKNDFFVWLFESFGEFGFLCDDLNEIKHVISELNHQNYKKKNEEFKNNMRQFKIDNNLSKISLKLEAIL
ncbi:hypothetical protein BSF41_42510 [Flavobacterium sp. ACN2]|jgi:hypothetical protein|uniref:hypothetical protein n=1 Tax=unclassified Flavobacterium TaxID=196869 RepID=UPI000BB3BFEB|nr:MULTISPECIES: hypothetical protein [unclassified Flavobacterium]MDY0987397.1 hypothetical protein [Flavobacterium sp. CFBP9031]PBI84152.1 hypothetical protein BSF41_42510 [Flavobacterium sp. ACN2]